MRTLSIVALSTAAITTGAQSAVADPRIDIDGESCREVRRIVADTGAAVLRYTSRQSDRILYDRFVASSYFCQPGEEALPETVFRREGTCRLLTCQVPDHQNRFRPWIIR
ncbi:hypothetical protein [Notoacmeibacter marinus]|uniref:hypothetical protein n=1 Tax=Notoacmeibacter marinus TaxID=1876515 RepID=UPI000DF3729B|nr:hypothetical protein [Notoacmeibacter marinus]